MFACVPTLLAACSSNTGSAHHVTGLTGLGATSKNWSSVHEAVPSSTGPAYGPIVVTGAGTKPKYTVVTLSNDHVVGWVMAFRAGTTLASAEHTLSHDLPVDVQQTSSSREMAQSGTGECEVVGYQSAQLAFALAGQSELANGTFSVSFFEALPTGSISTSYARVNRAIVGAPQPMPQPACLSESA